MILFKCPNCSREISEKDIWDEYYMKNHGRSVKKFSCHYCSKEFSDTEKLVLDRVINQKLLKRERQVIVFLGVVGLVFLLGLGWCSSKCAKSFSGTSCGDCYDVGWKLGRCMSIADSGLAKDDCDTIHVPEECDYEHIECFAEGLEAGRE